MRVLKYYVENKAQLDNERASKSIISNQITWIST